ncbi:MAG TPA: hypothetical protein VEB59_09210 [Gemmatimonadales bacterium]|nr:hypothetical protein [Gemmatimonadales bacterium]
MPAHTLTARLSGFGCPSTEARIVVLRLTTRERLARAGRVFGAGLVAALIALPIPLVHFVLVPGALLGGLTVGLLRLRHREIIDSAEGACPCCGKEQRLGLAGRVFRLPRAVHCEGCRRSLELG